MMNLNYVILGIFAFMAIYWIAAIAIGIWMFKDAKKRGIDPLLWLVIFLFSQGIGLILYFLVGRKETGHKCVQCHKSLPKGAKFCIDCGFPVENSEPAPIKSSSKLSKPFAIAIIVICGVISITSIGFTLYRMIGMVDMVDSLKNSTVFTGLYMTKSAEETINQWEVKASGIMMDGKAHYTFNFEESLPQSLLVTTNTEEGNLILHLKQEGLTKSYDITNKDKPIAVDLSDFQLGQVNFSLEHKDSKDFTAHICWD